jgi:hypothetical protein
MAPANNKNPSIISSKNSLKCISLSKVGIYWCTDGANSFSNRINTDIIRANIIIPIVGLSFKYFVFIRLKRAAKARTITNESNILFFYYLLYIRIPDWNSGNKYNLLFRFIAKAGINWAAKDFPGEWNSYFYLTIRRMGPSFRSKRKYAVHLVQTPPNSR